MLKVVILTLTVWNCNNGMKLFETEVDFSKHVSFNVQGPVDYIETCRKWGVWKAHQLTDTYRKEGYDNVSTNVNCHWVPDWGAPT